jgi:hypothetical protein
MHNFLLGAAKRIVLSIPKLFHVTSKRVRVKGKKRKRDDDGDGDADETGFRTTTKRISPGLTPAQCQSLYNYRISTFQPHPIISPEMHRVVDYEGIAGRSVEFQRPRYTSTFQEATDIKMLKATDYKYLVQLLQFVIGTGPNDFFEPEFTGRIQQVILQCNQLGALLYSTSPWNEEKIVEFDALLTTFGDNLKYCFGDVSASKAKWIKSHRMSHIVEDIRRFGSPRNYAGDPWEFSHQHFLKRIFPRTSGREHDMLQEVLRRELLRYTDLHLEKMLNVELTHEEQEHDAEIPLITANCTLMSFSGSARLIDTAEGSTWEWVSQGQFDILPTVPVSSVVFPELKPLSASDRSPQLNYFAGLLRDDDTCSDVTSVQFYKTIKTKSRITYRADRSFRGHARYDTARTRTGNLVQLLGAFRCLKGDFAIARLLVREDGPTLEHFPYPLYRLMRNNSFQVMKIFNLTDLDFNCPKPYMVPNFSSNTAHATYFHYQWWI